MNYVLYNGDQFRKRLRVNRFQLCARRHILRIVEERGSAKKTKRYVLTGAASTVPSSEDVERASVDDAVVRQNQFRSVDSNCTLFAVLNMEVLTVTVRCLLF